MYRVQQLLVRVPACLHPPVRPDRRGSRCRPRGHGRAAHEGQAQGAEVHAGHQPAGLHGLRRVREGLPGRRADHGRRRGRDGSAGRVRVLREQDRRQARDRGHHAARQPVQAAPARVLRRLRRLCPDGLRPPDHPTLRRPHVHLQRHRLLFHLGRSGCHQPVHGQQAGSRPRMVQQPVRGQRRARHGHEAGL